MFSLKIGGQMAGLMFLGLMVALMGLQNILLYFYNIKNNIKGGKGSLVVGIVTIIIILALLANIFHNHPDIVAQ